MPRHGSPRQHAQYERWVRELGPDVYRMAYRLCGDRDTAEDLTQETFYHAWKAMAALRDPSKARGWLFGILRRRYAHWVRHKTRRVQPRSLDAGVGPIPDPQGSPLAKLSDQDWLQTGLDDLDDTMKTPLLMVYLQGLTCRETAEALDLPLGTVLSRVHRAKQRLRSLLARPGRSGESPQPGEAGAEPPPPRFKLGDSA